MNGFDILLQNLKSLFDVRVFINGKVDMQKSLYFLKELGYQVPFNFRWSKLGPYSYELANYIERLTIQGYLEYTGKYEMNPKYFRYINPRITPQMKDFFLVIENITNEKKIDQVDFIECAASLHFIYKNSNDKEKGAIFQRLAVLKPHRINAFQPLLNDAWAFLENQKLLDS